MTDPTNRRSGDGDALNTPSVMDVSEVETTVSDADDSLSLLGESPSFLQDTIRANLGCLDDGSTITTRSHGEESDQPCYSEEESSEYYGSKPSTPVLRPQVLTDQSHLSDAGEVIGGPGSFGSDSDAPTRANHHVIDDYSFLSDADGSGKFEANLEASTLNSFLPDASTIIDIDDTTIKMENSSEPTAEPLSVGSDSAENENSGHAEVVEPNNLFFRQEDGTFLAMRIPSTQGRNLLQLLRGLTAPIGTPSHQTPHPFSLSSFDTFDKDLSSEAQNLSLVDDKPIISPFTNPTFQAPAKNVSIESSLDPSSGIFSTNASMDAIFSSTDGKSYDRDWIRTHNVNDDILKGTPSKHKLDLLVRHGAVIVGDRLCVTYHSLGKPVMEEGKILQSSTSSNLCVRIAPARAGFDGVLRSIQGPKDLITGMNKEYTARYDHAVLGGWKEVKLTSSTGQDFGSLYNVRQAYQVWADLKAKWVARRSPATA